MPEMTPQQKLAQGLRNAAAWYDEHPDAPVHGVGEVKLSAWIGHKEPDISLALEGIGPGDDSAVPSKTKLDGLFYRKVRGDGFALSFYTSLQNVYEQKVVGQRTEDVIEWVRKTND